MKVIIFFLLFSVCSYSAELVNIVSDFNGGLNTTNDMNLKSNEAYEIQNYKLSDFGDLKARKGCNIHCVLPNNPRIANIFEYKRSDDESRLIASGIVDNDTIVLYSIDPDDGSYWEISFPYALQSFDTYINTFWEQNDILYYIDKVNGLFKYNGVDTDNIYVAGIGSPSNTPTQLSTADTGGNITGGYYYYKYRSKTSDTNSWNETFSNPNDTYLRVNLEVQVDTTYDTYVYYSWDTTYHIDTNVVVAGDTVDTLVVIDTYYLIANEDIVENINHAKGSCTIANISISANPLVDYIEIYRSTVQGETIIGEPNYYYVGQIANGETVFYDNLNDTELGSDALDLSDNNTKFPACAFGEPYLNRFIGGGNDTNPYIIYVSGDMRPTKFNTKYQSNSEIYNPVEGATYNFSTLGKPTSIKTVNGNLVITTQNGCWAIYVADITDITTWEMKNISRIIGSLNHYANANLENSVVLMDKKGFYPLGISISGGSRIGSNPAFDPVFKLKVDRLFKSYIKDNYTQVSAYFADDIYRVSYCKDSTYNNRELIYDNNYKIWTEYSGHYIGNYVYTKDNKLFAGSSLGNGIIYQLEYLDNNLDGDTYYSLTVDTYINGTTSETIYFSSNEDTFSSDSIVGLSALVYNTDLSEKVELPIIKNGTNYIVIYDTFGFDVSNAEIEIGIINKYWRSGWQFGNAFLNPKKLEQIWFDCRDNSGDVEAKIYWDDDDNWDVVNVENQLTGDVWGSTFIWGVSRYGGTGKDERKKIYIETYPICEKYKIEFSNSTEDSLDLQYYVIRYEGLNIRDPKVQ